MTPALFGDNITDGEEDDERLKIELIAFAADPP
jgi:hypothetical protein